MKALQVSRYAVVLLFLAHAGASYAFDPICQFPASNNECDSNRYAMFYYNAMGQPVGDDTYCSALVGKYCMLTSAQVPPAPAWIQCFSSGVRQLTCSASPQGDMNFSWSASGQVHLGGAGSASGPQQTVYCNESHSSGMVSVTITAPNGYSETVFQGVSCGTIVQ